MFPLRCKAQQYAWGKPSASSMVARLRAAQGEAVDPEAPYAEYWFGTHPNGPSELNGQQLADWLKHNPKALGATVTREDAELPFLFKVLSIAKALSIQAHPDKPLAEQLHRDRPDIYKDPNHKPEMACALTELEGLCGFREPGEIVAHLRSVPEFRNLVGDAAASAFEDSVAASTSVESVKAALRELFAAYLQAPEADLKSHVDALAARISAQDPAERPCADATALRLSEEYPGDIGVFAPYLLNVLQLKPGEAFFMGANEPHAYLRGDCVECMASSDNVVRAGLTPKLKDVPVLLSMLTYNARKPAIMIGSPVDDVTRLYAPPADIAEFAMECTELTAERGIYQLPPAPSACILLVVSGAGTFTASDEGMEIESRSLEVSEGSVLFQTVRATVTVQAKGEGTLHVFRVHTNA